MKLVISQLEKEWKFQLKLFLKKSLLDFFGFIRQEKI